MRRGDGSRRRPRRLFRLLVRLYPADHRRMFGEPMVQTFRDHYRDEVEERGGSRLRFWSIVLLDVLTSVLKERVAAARWPRVRVRWPRLPRRRPRGRREPAGRVGRSRVARRLHYRRGGGRPERVVVRTRHRRLVYRGRIAGLIALPALLGLVLTGAALIDRLSLGELLAGVVVVIWLVRSWRLIRPVPAGRGGDGPEPPGGASVREPRRPLPMSPAGSGARPAPGAVNLPDVARRTP